MNPSRHLETPQQKCERVTSALEDLAAQEAASLEARDFAAVLEIQDRAQPLVDHLVAAGAESCSPEVRVRIGRLLACRDRSAEVLAAQLQQASEGLTETRASQRRVAQVAPAYGVTGSTRRRQLSFVG